MDPAPLPRRLEVRAVLCVLFSLLILPAKPGGAADAGAETGGPGKAAAEFYRILIDHRVTGLPTGEAWKQLEPRMTPKLIAGLKAAREEQEAFMKSNPGEKPPWIEGDLFSSLFEGPQSCTTGHISVVDGRAEVTMRFTYAEGGQTTNWVDTLILRKSTSGGGRWLVDDVRYEGGWDFAPKGTLSEGLAATDEE